MSVYQCPCCQSENTSKVSLIHDQGITRSKGTAWVGRDVGLYHLKSQSKTSRAAAPPSKDSEGLDLVIAMGEVFRKGWWKIPLSIAAVHGIQTLFILALVPIDTSFVVWGLYSLLLIQYIKNVIVEFRKNLRTSRKSGNTYAERLNRWSNSYQCMRCSNVFEIS
jgi:hypothetical protein